VLKDIAVQTKALVQILHIVKSELVSTGETPSKKTRQINFELLFNETPHEYVFLEEEHVVKGIEKAVKEFVPDILAMVPHKLEFWDVLLKRGKIDKIAMHILLALSFCHL
jgi:hypothetical protein